MKIVLCALAGVLCGSPVLAGGGAEVNAYYETDVAGLRLTAQVRGASGPAFALTAELVGFAPVAPIQAPLLGFGLLDANGDGQLSLTFPAALVGQLPAPVAVRALYLDGNGVAWTPRSQFAVQGAVFCDLLDFDHTIGADDVMVAGRTIDTQWADIGLTISARNNFIGHPDRAILFDTGNPTGDDGDLATPNPAGVANDEALGMALVIAENEAGANGPSGLVTVPDDEAYGGSLYFDFAGKATICSVTLLDVDESPGTELRFYRDGDLVTPDEVLPVASLGDGSVQTVHFFEPDVDRFEVYLRGSGAVPMLELVPCPRMIDFDETSTGIPMSFQAGEAIADQYASIGVTISAQNHWIAGGDPAQNHPDKAILFDSESPTGGDPDLLTPNPQVPGNDTPLGLVLIIAEDDVDAGMDGYVDDPDDEAQGGEIRFEFAQDVTILSARVLDVDGTEKDHFRFFDQFGAQISSILIPDAPDGNVQTLAPNVSGVRKAVLELGGSGAITRLRFCPEPVPVPGQQ